MRSTSAILYQQVPVQIRQTSIRDPTLPSAIFIFLFISYRYYSY